MACGARGASRSSISAAVIRNNPAQRAHLRRLTVANQSQLQRQELLPTGGAELRAKPAACLQSAREQRQTEASHGNTSSRAHRSAGATRRSVLTHKDIQPQCPRRPTVGRRCSGIASFGAGLSMGRTPIAAPTDAATISQLAIAGIRVIERHTNTLIASTAGVVNTCFAPTRRRKGGIFRGHVGGAASAALVDKRLPSNCRLPTRSRGR